jgi:hypothetical protein
MEQALIAEGLHFRQEYVPPGYEILKKSPLAFGSLQTSPEAFVNLPGRPPSGRSPGSLADGFFSARSMDLSDADGARCVPSIHATLALTLNVPRLGLDKSKAEQGVQPDWILKCLMG